MRPTMPSPHPPPDAGVTHLTHVSRIFLGLAAVVAVMAGSGALGAGLLGQIAIAGVFAAVVAFVLGGSLQAAADQSSELVETLQGKLRSEQEARQAAVAAAERAQVAQTQHSSVQAADAGREIVDTHTVGQLTAVVNAALDGNLVDRVSLQGKSGLLAELGSSLNKLLDSMEGAIRQIQTVSGEVSRGAEEISAGTVNLSQRTEEQSSSLEETASSMEEMTTTVKQNAANAGEANQLAIAARSQAESGGAVVGKAVSAMSEINDSSKKIADIIGVIDEIAFQTNLLALNAAVEAARAGEQGRGFAVVASEVRSLAGRSATAAKEIKELIQDSVRKVEDGSTLVTESGHTLEQIVVSVKKVSDIVAEIAAASREQSSGIEQVNRAVMQMDELTQQNGALVEQATSASQTLAEQARNLSQMMGHYRVSGAPASASPARAPLAAPKPAAPRSAPRAERRSANRPWAGQSGRTAAPAQAKSTSAKAAAAGAGEWQEF
jgi:methyl-accepting chemotaxis protein